jgi:hypothetical protein
MDIKTGVHCEKSLADVKDREGREKKKKRRTLTKELI